jgi:hypothetical protein
VQKGAATTGGAATVSVLSWRFEPPHNATKEEAGKS